MFSWIRNRYPELVPPLEVSVRLVAFDDKPKQILAKGESAQVAKEEDNNGCVFEIESCESSG